MEKYAILSEDSLSDFDTHPAKYMEDGGYKVASEKSKHLLKSPKQIEFVTDLEKQ